MQNVRKNSSGTKYKPMGTKSYLSKKKKNYQRFVTK